MKIFALVIAYLAAPSLGVGVAPASSEPARGDTEENADMSKVIAEIKSAIATIEKEHRRLDGSDSGTSCDCSTEAQVEIWTAYKEILDHVSPTFLGLLEEEKDLLGSTLGGLSYNPKYEYRKMLPSLEYLVHTATDSLKCMWCGPCDVHDIDSSDAPEPEPYNDFTARVPGISHYECCCDVKLIKDLVLKQMRSVMSIVTLNPGAADFSYAAHDSLAHTTACTIRDITRPYGCDDDTPETCPCFTSDVLEYADSKRDFDICQFIGEHRKIVDFDIVLHKRERSYAFCVGDNCEKHCEVEGGKCVAEEPPSDDMYCYAGIAWLGKPYPYRWFRGHHVKHRITDEQYEACCKIIEDFCEDKGFTAGGITADDDIEDPDF